MAIETESDDSINIKIYCNNSICQSNTKEMKYLDVKQEPNTLRIDSVCNDCLNRVKVEVKL